MSCDNTNYTTQESCENSSPGCYAFDWPGVGEVYGEVYEQTNDPILNTSEMDCTSPTTYRCHVTIGNGSYMSSDKSSESACLSFAQDQLGGVTAELGVNYWAYPHVWLQGVWTENASASGDPFITPLIK
jgi:hypothetical protein